MIVHGTDINADNDDDENGYMEGQLQCNDDTDGVNNDDNEE